MKKKIVNRSLILLGLVVSFGLFQAWKESRNPFAFLKEKSMKVSTKYTKDSHNSISNSNIELIKEQHIRPD